jgi:diguanylate cyclase (GGDEF)-like protein
VADNDEFTAVRKPRLLDSSAEQLPYVVVLTGNQVGRIYKLTRPNYVIGRATECDICLLDDGVSRRHAELVVTSPKVVTVRDLRSTNGTYVNGGIVEEHALMDGDRIQIGSTTILKFSVQDAIEQQFQSQLYAAATRDPLTDLPNRRVFDEQLARDLSHARRHAVPLSVAVIDVDYFKRINDTYGHPAGDAVLRQLGALLRESVRTEDWICRVGGEEFAGVMRHTPLIGAVVLSERLRHRISRHPFLLEHGPIHATVSIGVTTFDPERHEDGNQLFAEADQRLYAAKQGGRNRVVSM